MLARPAGNVAIAGFVEVREERERTDRIVVRVHAIEARGCARRPSACGVSVRKGMAPPVGAFVEVKARLNPPLRPLRPGGYDFARDLYFQRIGASGFVLGAIKTVDAAGAAGAVAALRRRSSRACATRSTRASAPSLPGDAGAIASALITGKRDAISAPVNDAMYISSLAHVLSISGYHMAVVAGVVFFVLRALLALIPALADALRRSRNGRRSRALIAALFYLLLSGAEVATQRSFIMTAIVLVGVMVDRPALTLAHARGRGARRAAARAGGGRASELPDVVCGDARADRRLRARPAVDDGRRRHARSARASRCGAGARSSR